jgi:hypothetical protein
MAALSYDGMVKERLKTSDRLELFSCMGFNSLPRVGERRPLTNAIKRVATRCSLKEYPCREADPYGWYDRDNYRRPLHAAGTAWPTSW